MQLVIVESPTKAKTLKKFLPSEFAVEASMGHVRDLPKSKLGIDVDHNFEPEYEVAKGKSKVVSLLKKKAKEADKIILAMDPDREGEAIAWHVKHILQGNGAKKKAIADTKFTRVTFHEITKAAIEKALQTPGTVNDALVDAQQARRVVDRLVGYTLSPVLWKKIRRGLSAGRVQSVALRLIVEREAEIEAFKPQEYWDVAVQVKPEGGKKDEAFLAQLVELAGKKIVVKGEKEGKNLTYLDSKKVVEPILADLKKAGYQVVSVERKERKKNPYPPYTTSTLQQAAANMLGWSGKQTMSVAQQLYEAGFITYHRTDSFNIAAEAITSARKVIGDRFGAEYVPEKPNYYQTKSKNAQEAHEAIRPTNIDLPQLGDEKNGLTERHEKLYRLIWRRFVACQMKQAVFDQTSIGIKAQGKETYGLRASGSILKFDGWRKAYEKTKKQAGEDVILPEVKEGQGLDYLDLTAEQKATQPPPRFNDASLVKELEKRGIGRPSTYAPIISVIIDRGYIERLEKRFHPTAVGKTVVEFLKDHFTEIMDYDFTAEMEEDLDRIARSEKDWHALMKTFYSPFKKKITSVEKDVARVAIPVEQTGEKCPECKEGDLVIRTGRFGKFYSCGRFPECKYTANYTEKLDDFPCPECGSEVVLKRTKRGRSFYGCSAYPKCDWASWQDPRQKKDSKSKK